jgi:diguanylate cyclase (GGDEF)-like protein
MARARFSSAAGSRETHECTIRHDVVKVPLRRVDGSVVGVEEPGQLPAENRAARLVAYAAAPIALPLLVLLRAGGFVARAPLWAYAAALIGTVITSRLVDRWKTSGPGTLGMHLRIVTHVAGVTAVIYMCGWGPVLGMGYVFSALAELEQSGAPTWRAALGWSVVGCAVGQALIWVGWAPTLLPRSSAETVGLLGVVVFAFALRMAGAIGEHKERAEQALAYQAQHDPLTGLSNRSVLVAHLARVIEGDRRLSATRSYVLFLDLNRFKTVNDTFGHGAGDRLLCDVAGRLRSVVRAGDTLARFGGDEFVVLLRATDDDAVRAVARRIVDLFDEPFMIADEPVQVGVSIGIARVDDHVTSGETLLSEADAAMYFAKAHGGGGKVEFFDGTARRSARDRMRVESDLVYALERDEFRLVYSPIVNINTGRVGGVQTVLRWQHPTRGLLEPEHFVEAAEHTGLIVPIGAWVMATAFATVARWNDRRPPEDQLHLSLGLSPRQLDDPELARRVDEQLRASGLASRLLYVAFKVSDGMLSTEGIARQQLAALHAAGVTLAIDDFGTGHSTLESVRDLPVRGVRIASSFVATIDRDDRSRRLVAGMIDLLHRLDLVVVADGVERASQHEILSALSCDYGQGIRLGRPQPWDELVHSPALADRNALEQPGSAAA